MLIEKIEDEMGCANDCPEKDRSIYNIEQCRCYKFEVIEEIEQLMENREKLEEALEESVKLQSHYAGLLNMYDGGKRTQFQNIDEWIMRLEEVKNS